MRRILSIILLLAMTAALTACGSLGSGGKAEKYNAVMFDAFDTAFSLTAYCESGEEFKELQNSAQDILYPCHQLFDIYNSYPEINNLRTVNENAGIAPVEVDRRIIDLLLFSREMYTLSHGRMNVAMGGVLRLWHEARAAASEGAEPLRLPDSQKLLEAAEHCDIDCLVIDEEAGTVFITDPDMSLDVGAVAKGFTTELMARQLMEQGFDSFIINAGGNVRCCGAKPDGSPWIVAVTNPGLNEYKQSVGTIEVPGGSVVTSGSYQRYFELDGVRYHHIIDPETLYPENRYLSVTVVTEDSALADALSTCLFNMEPEEGLGLVKSLTDTEAMWVLPDGSFLSSDGFNLKQEGNIW